MSITSIRSPEETGAIALSTVTDINEPWIDGNLRHPLMQRQLFPAVFLDRDGTLMEEVDYCRDPERVQVFPNVPSSLRRLKQAGFRLIIITNQSGIGRGILTEADFHVVQAELLRQLGPGLIDGVYFAPETPDQPSIRRKPGPG